MEYSIIIILRNEITFLEGLLNSLLHQKDIVKNEIIFIDGNSTDGSYEYLKQEAKKHSFIKVYKSSKSGFASQRNLGLRKARGKIIFFISADTYAEDGWIEKMLTKFGDKKTVAVQGRIKNLPYKSLMSKILSKSFTYIYQRHKTGTNADYFSTVNVGIKKSQLKELKFDDKIVPIPSSYRIFFPISKI